MKQLFPIVLLVCFFNTSAQNISSDLHQLNSSYLKLNQKIKVSTELTIGSQTKNSSYEAYMRSIHEFYMKSSTTETLVRSGLKVVLNKSVNTILLDSIELDENVQLPTAMFDSLLTFYISTKHTHLSNGIERYEIVPATIEIEKIIIDFYRSSMLLKSITVHSRSENQAKSRLKVSYQYATLKPGDIPRLSKYVYVSSNGQTSLAKTYSGFRLINFLKQ